jgi:thiamine-phosphate pyrophosphorylase
VIPRLIVVTPGAPFDMAALRAAADALPPGMLAVQLREKEDRGRRVNIARILRELLKTQLLVVNSDVELAREVGADGVHLPRGGVAEARDVLPSAWITVAAHDDEDVRRAVAEGADAVLVSPIFSSPGKGPPRGLEAIRAARAIAKRRGVYALGGVDCSNAASCYEAGATGVAVIRAVFDASDPAAAAHALVAPPR